MRSSKNVLFHGRKKPQRVRLEPDIKRVKQLKIDGFCPVFDRFRPLFDALLSPSSRTLCSQAEGNQRYFDMRLPAAAALGSEGFWVWDRGLSKAAEELGALYGLAGRRSSTLGRGFRPGVRGFRPSHFFLKRPRRMGCLLLWLVQEMQEKGGPPAWALSSILYWDVLQAWQGGV